MAIITACGSGKNRVLIHSVCEKLAAKGHIVLPPPLHDMNRYREADKETELLTWEGATFSHFNRIRTANVCLMLNPGGYLGVGSTLELGYAAAQGKFIIALRHDTELAREALFDIVLDCENADDVAEQADLLVRRI